MNPIFGENTNPNSNPPYFKAQFPNGAEEKLVLEVNSITYQNQESGFTVFKAQLDENGQSIVAVGQFFSLFPGQTYLVSGQWMEHKQFGKQFKIKNASACIPTTSDAIGKYLSSGLFKGVGEKTAKKLVKHFGNKTLQILEDTPEKIKTVPKLNKKIATKLIRMWREHRTNSDALIFLINHGITLFRAQKIIDMLGQDTVSIVSKNPYILISLFKGIGFLTADKIARSMGINETAPERIREGTLYVLHLWEEKGHCYILKSQLLEQINKTLVIEMEKHLEKFAIAIEMLLQQGSIVLHEVDEEVHFSSKEIYLAEKGIAQVLIDSLKSPQLITESHDKQVFIKRAEIWLEKFEQRSELQLSDEQKKAVVEAANNQFFILTGGPGVGKTTTVHAMIQMFKAMGKSVALGAPTGRAAQRLSEVCGVQAKTIHRLLEWSVQEKRFMRNRTNPLLFDILIIDETSMLDVKLAESLFSALMSRTQMVLIGDQDQLPSVGAGNVLKDLLSSGKMPNIGLTQIFRQKQTSHIIQTAHSINRGEPVEFKEESTSDCRFFSAEDPKDIKKIIKDLLTLHLPKAGFDPIKEVQILSPMQRGDLGCQKLNEELQELLNPAEVIPGLQKNKLQLRPNDKVIQIVNDYDLGVFNGDIGFVSATQFEKGKTVVQFADRFVVYDQEKLSDLALAYTITIHKSQGSEFPVVIIPMSFQHYIMLQKNLLYTALTRAKKLAIFVGESRAFSFGSRNTQGTNRQTHLREWI